MLNKRYANRLQAMLVAAICILLVLLGRMAYMQLWRGDFYGDQADGNRLRRTKVVAPRGIFYDRDGEELVNNLPGYVVALRRQNSPYDAEILNLLSEIIEMPVAEMQKKIEANSDSYEPTRLKTNITPEMLTKLEEKKNELPGVMIEIQPVRNYLYKELAVHAIGYVGEVAIMILPKALTKICRLAAWLASLGWKKLTTVMCAARTAVMTKKLMLEAM